MSSTGLRIADRLAALPQYLLPKLALTRLLGRLADARGGRATTAVIRAFVGRYGVAMAEAERPDPAAYATFNEFFTRALRPGARPIASADWVCPVDGRVSQCGAIAEGGLLQAKGERYTVQALLGGDAALAASFAGGHFATLYLSPRDYHRIHMPAAGRLRRMVHVPGALFSVNPATVRGVPGLFARNERVVCLFVQDRQGCDAAFGMVLVGATVVGSIATAWHGGVNPPRPGKVRSWAYDEGELRLAQGQEMGRFLLGSTVVLLLPPGPLALAPGFVPGAPVRMGQAMASAK